MPDDAKPEPQAGTESIPETKPPTGGNLSDERVEEIVRDMDLGNLPTDPAERVTAIKQRISTKLGQYERGIEKKLREYDEELDDLKARTAKKAELAPTQTKEEVTETFEDLEASAETQEQIRAIRAVKKATLALLKQHGVLDLKDKFQALENWRGLKDASDISRQSEVVKTGLSDLRKEYGDVLVDKYEAKIVKAASDPRYANVTAERFLITLATPSEIRKALTAEKKEPSNDLEEKKRASQPKTPAQTGKLASDVDKYRKRGTGSIRDWMKDNINMGEIKRKAGMGV